MGNETFYGDGISILWASFVYVHPKLYTTSCLTYFSISAIP